MKENKYLYQRPWLEEEKRGLEVEPPGKFSKSHLLLWLRMHLPISGMVWATWNFDSLWQLFTRRGAWKIVSWSDIIEFYSNYLQVDFPSYSLLSADNYAIGN